MRTWLSPETFNNIAIMLAHYRWKLLMWSVFAFVLFVILQYQVVYATPQSLIWLVIFILFAALQALVLSSFIFFFQVLPSTKITNKKLYKFYRAIEWCEAVLFGFILPLPILLFVYAYITI